RAADRRPGEAAALRRDRDADAAAGGRRLRPRARDRPAGAALPRDHRVHPAAEGVPTDTRRGLTIAAEIVGAVAAATGLVALLEPTTPAVRLEALYLLAVLAVAVRRGEGAALITAVLSGLAVNFFFIAPRHQLAIAHSRDLVQLIVLLIAALVVGRLAALARQRAAEAELRAREARR